MGNKLINFLIWTIVIVLVLGVLWVFLEPIIWWTSYSEIRLCVRLFLLMFALNTFAVLRLYNSIVQNTRFNIKLREALAKFANVFPGFERAIKGLYSALQTHKASMDSLKKETSDNTDSIKKLIDIINKKNLKN